MGLLAERLREHDVSGGTTKRSLPLLLSTGDAITGATITVFVVDPETGEPVADDTLAVWGDAHGTTATLTWGLVTGNTNGDTWAINFYLLGGTAGTMYYLQLTYFLASQPGVPIYDEMYRVFAVA